MMYYECDSCGVRLEEFERSHMSVSFPDHVRIFDVCANCRDWLVETIKRRSCRHEE